MESIDFQSKRMFFWVNPFVLLFGKLYIHNLYVYQFIAVYIHKIPPEKMKQYLPKPNSFKIIHSNLLKGFMEVIDKTQIPNYKIKLKNIDLHQMSYDVGRPLSILFNCKRGRIDIGSGYVQFKKLEKNKGRLHLSGVTWAEIISMEEFPVLFMKHKVNLDFEYIHKKEETQFIGTFEQISDKNINLIDTKILNSSIIKPIPFSFNIHWNEYNEPFDVALRKWIFSLVSGLSFVSAIGETVSKVSDVTMNFFKLFQKEGGR